MLFALKLFEDYFKINFLKDCESWCIVGTFFVAVVYLLWVGFFRQPGCKRLTRYELFEEMTEQEYLGQIMYLFIFIFLPVCEVVTFLVLLLFRLIQVVFGGWPPAP